MDFCVFFRCFMHIFLYIPPAVQVFEGVCVSFNIWITPVMQLAIYCFSMAELLKKSNIFIKKQKGMSCFKEWT